MTSDKGKINIVKQKIQRSAEFGIPMGQKLFLFLVVLVLTIILGVVGILMITGSLTAGLKESEQLVENELIHASEEITQQYGQLSTQAINFSKGLSRSIEKKANDLGISLSSLHEYPDMLEEIVSNELEQTLLTLQISKSSGVFFILNATINPNLVNANNSKAGLYIKNMEPNIINSSSPTITVLRGFPSISRNNSLPLNAQWKMEFDTNDASYYFEPMVEANLNKGLPLSRLYYWSNSFVFPDTSEKIMLCSVPLIDSKGNVFGVSGLEVSSMLFKLSHAPNNREFPRLFSVLSPTSDEHIFLDKSMIAGSLSTRIVSKENSSLNIVKNKNSLYSYWQSKDNLYWGTHITIKLYPEDSIFHDGNWIVALMMPDEDIITSIARINLLLFSLLVLLFVLGVFASFILSKRFVKPISEGLNILKSSDLSEAPKTKVPEIDDLIDFLSNSNGESSENTGSDSFSLSLLNEFIENTKKLSPAERSVFNLYVQGHTAKEIAAILYISINTVKTHNKRIYSKLNVSSRNELLLYINMLREVGKEFN
ncbi:MAG: LuxR C-terminal-related transcriptional regulator [Tissierellales bacterium]